MGGLHQLFTGPEGGRRVWCWCGVVFFLGGTGCFFFEKKPGNILDIQLFDPGGRFMKNLIARVFFLCFLFCRVFLKT